MKKKFLSFVCALMCTMFMAIPVSASTFDANYYANKYPDVVARWGTNAEVLENHYNLIGKNEGRFPNAQDELAVIQASLPAVAIPQPEVKVQVPEATSNTLVWDDSITPNYKYNTYVDVDIPNQTVTFFKDGKSVFVSPCVTGNPNMGHSTPTGTFKILQHTNGKRLIGKTWNVWVNKWMKFTSDSCGLHDASWRKNFGGTIYQKNGSHGCVNLPKDVAYYLFDQVDVGTVVVVH